MSKARNDYNGLVPRKVAVVTCVFGMLQLLAAIVVIICSFVLFGGFCEQLDCQGHTKGLGLWLGFPLVTRRDRKTRDMLQSNAFYIVPVFNPDGYQYTQSTDRLWRKTRSRSSRSECVGTDPNRNWNILWGEFDSSKDPCSTLYQGKRPESEKCVKNYASMLRYMKPRLQSYWSLHSFGQSILIPHSYTTMPSRDIDRLVPAGVAFLNAVRKTHGKNYGLGTAMTLFVVLFWSNVSTSDPIQLTWKKHKRPNTVHKVFPFQRISGWKHGKKISGTSFDYIHDKLNITYAFTIEMRPGAILNDEIEFDSGFLSPPEEIEPASKEVFAGIISSVEHINAIIPI